jgi:DNA recombination protein RmuC
METLLIVVAVLVGVVLAVVLFQLGMAPRHERALRAELASVRAELAAAQNGAADRVGAGLRDIIDRVHQALGDLGQQVRGEQSATGEALQTRLEETRRTLSQQLEGLVGAVNAQLSASQQTFGQQFEGATKVFGEVRGQLGQVAEMAARMEALGREINELQGILKAPKLRGNLGEAQLEEFLRQVLPPAFWSLQHRFADGQIVDAAIRLRDHLVPVDAKFPLEAFQRMLAADADDARRARRREFERSVKGRIDEIAAKYIRPGEGTYEFALMFIPAENVYYEVIVRDDALGSEGSLLNYAMARRVVPVSPNSFYAYLQTIATGLKGMQVEAQAREIMEELGKLQKEFSRFEKVFQLVGTHLGNAVKQYEESSKIAGRVGERLEGITGAGPGALPAAEHEALPKG